MHLHALDYVLWVITPCLQICILSFFRGRRLTRQFPCFYAYTLFQVASDIYLLVAERASYRVYFYSYWIGIAASVLLTFALVDELFVAAFRNLNPIRNLGGYIFRWGTSILAAGACINALSSSSQIRVADLTGIVLVADRTARGMLCLLALLLLVGARTLRLPARSTLFGLTVGFVVYTSGKVLLDSAAMQHLCDATVITRISGVLYLISCLLWLWYSANGEDLPERNETRPYPHTSEPLIDSINALVEESMRNESKTP